MTDATRALPSPGDYLMKLIGVERYQGYKFHGVKLYLEGTAEVEHTATIDSVVCYTLEKPKVFCFVFGNMDNLIAWQRLLNQEFCVRAKHRIIEDRILIDTRLINQKVSN